MPAATLLAACVLSLADPSIRDAATLPPLGERCEPADALLGHPLLFSDDFEAEGRGVGLDEFDFTDRDAWTVLKQNDNRVLALTVRKSDYKPPVRSPHNIALVKDVRVGDMALDVRFQTAMTDYNHRSLCLFFGYQNPSHFYYVHFGQRADPHANQIFVVNAADRLAISETTTDGTPWDDAWHHARITRDATTGAIAVYFDDMEHPAMTATDHTFGAGRVGVGSFDDAGSFDCLAVYGERGAE